jgi:beta-lactamase regulating signal transducer with metallopeptidase domain
MIAALLDHLWQSTLFAAVVCLVMPLFRSNSAAVRFWLWFSASAKFLMPLSIFVIAGRHLLAPVAMPAHILFVIQPVAIPFSANVPVLALPAVHHLMILDLAAAAWAFGAIAVLARWLLHGMRLRRALRRAANLPLAAPIPVKSIASLLEPGLVGIWHPVILLPEGIAERLSGKEMQAVIAHELCHLQRRDNLLAALQMLIEALFWFHPLVWWLGGRLVEAREHACDESVLAAGNHPVIYAEGILKICRFYVQSPLACASGVSGGGLQTRVGTILANREVTDVEPPKCLLLSVMALSLVLMPLLAGGMGSAPVTRLAAKVAHALAAPDLVPVSRMQIVPVKPAAHPHSARRHPAVAASERTSTNGVAKAVESTLPPPEAGAPVPQGNAATANTIVPAMQDSQTARVSDPIVCRLPQPLPGSRFSGPTICKSKSEWAQLRAQGKDVSPDGRTLVETSEKYRTLHPQACGAATMGGGGATTANFTTFSPVCF